jgi:hypothetical protein
VRVFPTLCMKAREAGASSLHFVAELATCLATDEAGGVGAPESWSCTAYSSSGPGPLAKAYGRTGEEALRELVQKLENPPPSSRRRSRR